MHIKVVGSFLLVWFLAAVAGCTRESQLPSGNARTGLLLRVVAVVYETDWVTAEELSVQHDGSYKWIVYSDEYPGGNKTLRGQLSRALMDSLRRDISLRKEFILVNGVPTYEYGLDDSKVVHPPAIGELLNAIAEHNTEAVEKA